MTTPSTPSANVKLKQVEVPKHPIWPELSPEEKTALKEQIKILLKDRDAVLVAHYYTTGELQELAEETGGCVADSLEMARFGTTQSASTLVVAGVRFMGETSKILNPEKRVLMPDLGATCSLDEGCPADQFSNFCDQYPDHTVVVYANTSAEVKARSDWVVTSSIALPIVEHLAAKGEKILWAPDKHLGRYVQEMTGADMILWPGSCVVHEEFKSVALERIINVPKRGLGDATIQKIHQLSRAHNIPMYRAARQLCDTDGLRPQARTSLKGLLDDFDRQAPASTSRSPHTDRD